MANVTRGVARSLRFAACFALLTLPSSLEAVQPTNLAPFGTATGSTASFGSSMTDGIDGNRDGNFNSGSVWHSPDPNAGPLPFYQIDLGSTNYLDRVQLFPRTDARQQSLRNFRISVFADNGGVPGAALYTEDFFTTGTRAADTAANRGWATRVGGVQGRFVRFEKLDAAPVFATFAEMEVWGATTLLPQNLSLGATITASEAAGFSTSLATINDGILNSDYGYNNGYIYHSATMGVGRMVTLSLASVSTLDYIQLFARGEAYTMQNVRVKVLDAANGVLSSQDVFIPNGNTGYDFQLNFPGLANAKSVTLETIGNEFLALGEVGVFGTPVPEPGSVGLLAAAGLGLLRRRRK